MRAASTLIAIGTALWVMAAGPAHALGFGRVVNTTQLGQPLNFSAAVRVETDETLPRECVAAEVQSGDNKLPAGAVRVTLENEANGADYSVRVTTSGLIDEPVVTVSVTVGCNARITRRFVVFIDPPLINAPLAEAPPALPPQRVDSAVAPIVRMVESDRVQPSPNVAAAPTRVASARAASAPRRAPARPTTTAAAARPAATASTRIAAASPPAERASAAPVAPRPGTSRSVAAALPAQTNGPRLKLESAPMAPPAVAASASPPALVGAPNASIGLAAAAVSPVDDKAVSETEAQLARERERFRALEDGLAKLRADSIATQQSLASLQARLHQAESERYANPLVYGLAWLSALLALAVATLWWRQSRARGDGSPWWAAPIVSRLSEPGAESRPSSPGTLESPITAADAFGLTSDSDTGDPAVDRTTTRTVPMVAPASMRAPAPVAASATAGAFAINAAGAIAAAGTAPHAAAAAPARELSVEELIDLEQQAEFFIVLGQDEAAIDLLMSHVRSEGGISPLPYLKLLEIYRRRGERDAYERIRERFNRRFNAYAADWESDLQKGRALVDYPDIVARLQSLWPVPARVMETLDASLFRRHRDDETFDLPAYRELLFLYSVARDLAEHRAAAPARNVDLLLPIDEADEAPISHLSATGHGEFQNSDMMTMPLDLDVSLEPRSAPPAQERGRPPASPTPPAASAPTPIPAPAPTRAVPSPSPAVDTAPAALHRSTPTPPFADSGALDLDLSAPGLPFQPGHVRRR